MENKHVFDAKILPEDKQYVIYYFQPFERWYTGKFYYDGADNSVVGTNGFSTWYPEVTMWMKGEEKC